MSDDYAWLCPKDLLVDADVQRSIDKPRVDAIAKDFDPLLVGLLTVSLREDGHYRVVDGQHRKAACEESGHGDVPVLCRVYRGLSLAEEAKLFIRLQEKRKPVGSLDVFRVQVEAQSPAHCDVQRIVESFGIRIAASHRDGGVSAVVALLQIYQGKVNVKSSQATQANALPKGQLLSRTLHVLKTAWGKDRNAFDKVLLIGVAAMLHKHGTSLDGQRLAKALAKSGTAMQAIGGIKGLQSLAKKGPVPAAIEWLEGRYNAGRRKDSRVESE